MATYPVSYRPEYVEQRNRLTVFFRFLLAIPLMIVGFCYGIAAVFTIIGAWFALMVTGRYPEGLWRVNTGFLRYWARLGAYTYLQADPYPPFDTGEHPEYPVRVVIDPPQESYNRVTVFFRLILAIPVYIVMQVFSYVMMAVALVMWIVAVVTGKTPRGLFDVMTFLHGFAVRVTGYSLFLLTDRYPVFTDDAARGYGPQPYGEAAPA